MKHELGVTTRGRWEQTQYWIMGKLIYHYCDQGLVCVEESTGLKMELR